MRGERPTREQSVRRLVGRRGLAEFGIVGGCLLLYFLVRGSVVDRVPQADAHALDLIRLETNLGFFWELSWQKLILGSTFWTQFWNFFYFWLHGPLIAVVAFILYFKHRGKYSTIRTAFLISCLIGLFIYDFYPVTPPRLLPRLGFVDTVQRYADLSYQAESLKPFVNPYAALPSLHFGWAFLISVGIAWTWRTWWAYLAAAAETVGMFFAVVVTGNHFIIDAIAGFIVCGVALALALWMHSVWLPRGNAWREQDTRGEPLAPGAPASGDQGAG